MRKQVEKWACWHAGGGASGRRTYPCTLTALTLSALGSKPTKGQSSNVRDRSEPSFDGRCEGWVGVREARRGFGELVCLAVASRSR